MTEFDINPDLLGRFDAQCERFGVSRNTLAELAFNELLYRRGILHELLGVDDPDGEPDEDDPSFCFDRAPSDEPEWD